MVKNKAESAVASRAELEELSARLAGAEKALKTLRGDFDQVLNHDSHGIRIINRDHTLRLINQVFATMSGVNPGDAIGKRCYDVFPSPLCHTPDCRLKRIMNGDSVFQAEIERVKPGGLRVPCVVNAAPFRNEKGELAGVIETFTDITEH